MVDIERSAPLARAPIHQAQTVATRNRERACNWHAGRSVRCAGAHHQNRNPSAPGTIAFGGYSFPGVGQYEVITGIATGEVNPSSPQNAVITDINLAPINANGNVVYQHNFYILKPLNLKQGNHKMMYEPPNRGGKTYQTLNNTPTDSTNMPAEQILA